MRQIGWPIAILMMIGCWGLGALHAEEKILILDVGTEGYPPFMIAEKGAPVSGMMVDVFKIIATRLGYRMDIARMPRKRIGQMLENGKIDASPMPRAYAYHPERFLFTEPVFQHCEVIISRVDSPVDFHQPEDLKGKRIGTHLGYVYKALDPYFESGQMKRVETSTHRAMLVMLLKMRSDVTILEKHLAKWYMKQNGWQDKLVLSKTPLECVSFGYMLAPNKAPLVKEFNRELAQLRENGVVQQIIDRYR